jgi:hypothetical protein
MQEGHRSLIDIGLAAQKVTRKFDPQAGAVASAPPRKPNQKPVSGAVNPRDRTA